MISAAGWRRCAIAFLTGRAGKGNPDTHPLSRSPASIHSRLARSAENHGPWSLRTRRTECPTLGKPWGRVAPGIAPWGSHRSGRAQSKTHPVRHVVDSLSLTRPGRFAVTRW